MYVIQDQVVRMLQMKAANKVMPSSSARTGHAEYCRPTILSAWYNRTDVVLLTAITRAYFCIPLIYITTTDLC